MKERAEVLLYRNEFKYLLQKHTSEARITNITTVDSLKTYSLIATGESVEKVMEKPRVLVHAEAQRAVPLVTEETGGWKSRHTSVYPHRISLLRAPLLSHTLTNSLPLPTHHRSLTSH